MAISNRSRGINRAFDILDHLQKSKKPMLVSQIADEIQAPKSSVYEIVKVLISKSVLEMAGQEKKIFLGRKLYMYASAFKNQFPWIELADPIIEKLAQDTGEIAELTSLVDLREGILISKRGKRHFWWAGSGSGMSSPLPLTSAGQLLCSHMSLEEIETSFTPEDYQYDGEQKITSEEFYRSCQIAKKKGFGVTNGLLDKYLSAVSVPLYDNRSCIFAVVCVVFPTGELGPRLDEFIDKATLARDEIQQILNSQ